MPQRGGRVSFLKHVYEKYLRPAHDYVKKGKYVSSGLKLLGKDDWAKTAEKAGYGRRRRHRRRR